MPLPNPQAPISLLSTTISVPPGMVGELASSIFQTSARPVAEAAVVTALGLFAGISGGAFQVQGISLSAGIVLIVQTCVVDEALHQETLKIVREVSSRDPAIKQFVSFTANPMVEALTRAISAQPSFVHIPCQSIKLDRELIRIDKAMSTSRMPTDSGGRALPAGCSFIGDTTPRALSGCVKKSILQEDLLHGLILVEFKGDRPELNQCTSAALPVPLSRRIDKLCQFAKANLAGRSCTSVDTEAQAKAFLNDFDAMCTAAIKNTENDVKRRMWDKAHAKLLRVAAILAVADNCFEPMINLAHATWAHELVLRNIEIVRRLDVELGAAKSCKHGAKT